MTNNQKNICKICVDFTNKPLQQTANLHSLQKNGFLRSCNSSLRGCWHAARAFYLSNPVSPLWFGAHHFIWLSKHISYIKYRSLRHKKTRGISVVSVFSYQPNNPRKTHSNPNRPFVPFAHNLNPTLSCHAFDTHLHRQTCGRLFYFEKIRTP